MLIKNFKKFATWLTNVSLCGKINYQKEKGGIADYELKKKARIGLSKPTKRRLFIF